MIHISGLLLIDLLLIIDWTFCWNSFHSRIIIIIYPVRINCVQICYTTETCWELLRRRLLVSNLCIILHSFNLAIRRTYPGASLTYIEKTTSLPVPPRKDSVSTLATSLCVYQFCCSCRCKYIGRTVRNLSTCIGKHILHGWGPRVLAFRKVL